MKRTQYYASRLAVFFMPFPQMQFDNDHWTSKLVFIQMCNKNTTFPESNIQLSVECNSGIQNGPMSKNCKKKGPRSPFQGDWILPHLHVWKIILGVLWQLWHTDRYTTLNHTWKNWSLIVGEAILYHCLTPAVCAYILSCMCKYRPHPGFPMSVAYTS